MEGTLIPDIPILPLNYNSSFLLIAGPCVVENRDVVFETATILKAITTKLDIPLIFKASYRKANRTRSDSFKGIGDIQALEILSDVHTQLGIPVITDVHESSEVDMAAKYVDVLQIPAFLCRQTDLIKAAARTGKPVNLKKGQFLSPESMRFGIEKILETGNNKILLTERGSTFGYGDLVIDFRSIPIMKQWKFPVILDITHSLQQPNQPGGITGGQPGLIETIARAGIAAGVNGIFMETHPNPAAALSDGANMLHLSQAERLLSNLLEIYKLIQSLDSIAL
ncbi:MAG: 3-deoxy-8-phosphooctulonate synthase [Porphyromonadaceae bacterium]|nr:MAG: 3-deoxy-8-phosphooctulonate synthase [Porphyromonadaceae bacterium]